MPPFAAQELLFPPLVFLDISTRGEIRSPPPRNGGICPSLAPFAPFIFQIPSRNRAIYSTSFFHSEPGIVRLSPPGVFQIPIHR